MVTRLIYRLMGSRFNWISPTEYKEQFFDAGVAHTLVDVRTKPEYQSGHVQGARLIPVTELNGRLRQIPEDKPVFLVCESGSRSAQAAALLERAGFEEVYNITHGTPTCARIGLPMA